MPDLQKGHAADPRAGAEGPRQQSIFFQLQELRYRDSVKTRKACVDTGHWLDSGAIMIRPGFLSTAERGALRGLAEEEL